jgi:zinc protease
MGAVETDSMQANICSYSRASRLTALALSALLFSTAYAKPTVSPTPTAATAKATVAKITAKKVTSVEGITEYVLPNGLRVLLFPDPASSVITVNLTYLVGSRHEGYGETGMAHLLEHLLFKGSKGHTNIPKELTEHGARPNGTTWLDRTNYFETFQASQKNLEWALSLESDRMINSFIAKKDLDTEMTVVRNEFESGENDPQSILSERVTQSAYLWHNYGNPTIGARSDIELVPIERLQGFYRKYYQPDNSVLVVAGKIDETSTLAMIEKYFGPIPKPTRKLIPTYTQEPTQDGERTVTLRRVGDSQAAIVNHHIPSGSHTDFAAIDVLGVILSDNPSGRLYKALVEPGLASSVGGGAYQLKEPGFTTFSISVPKDKPLTPATDVLVKVVEEAGNTLPTKEELERAKTQLLKSIELTLNSSERLALQISEWEAMGDWRHFFLYRDRLKTVTAEQVQEVAKKYLVASNRTLGTFVPTATPVRAEIPQVKDPRAAVRDYKGQKALAAGEAFDPTCKNCDARDSRKVLAGGLKLATFPKKTRGQTVHFAMSLHFGDLESLKGRGTEGDVLGDILMRGTLKHTRAQIQDEFDRLKAAVGVSTSAGGAAVSIETTRDNLIPTLNLVAEILREPSFDAKEFETWKQQSIAANEEERSDPQSIVGTEKARHMSPYPKEDPRYVGTVDEDIAEIKKVSLEGLKAYHRDFMGANVGEIAVVGDFDARALESVLEKNFGNWKSAKPFTRISYPNFDVAAVDKAFPVKDKANAVIVGALNLKVRDDDADYPSLVMANYILGGGFLNSRLATRIRQKEGLSYGVGSSFGAGSIDHVGSFGTYAICAPQNLPKVQKALVEEIQRAIDKGFTQEELDTARTGYLQAREGGRSKDSSVAGTLVRYQFLNRRYTWDEAYENKIRALKPEQLQAALKKYIQVSKMSFFKSGDI